MTVMLWLRTRADVDNLDAIVPKRSDDQLILPVKPEMVESPLNSRHRNRFGQDQRPRRFRRR